MQTASPAGDRSIADAVAEYDRLVGAGVTGTAGEMQLLADRLTAAGARPGLDPAAQHAQHGRS